MAKNAFAKSATTTVVIVVFTAIAAGVAIWAQSMVWFWITLSTLLLGVLLILTPSTLKDLLRKKR